LLDALKSKRLAPQLYKQSRYRERLADMDDLLRMLTRNCIQSSDP